MLGPALPVVSLVCRGRGPLVQLTVLLSMRPGFSLKLKSWEQGQRGCVGGCPFSMPFTCRRLGETNTLSLESLLEGLIRNCRCGRPWDGVLGWAICSLHRIVGCHLEVSLGLPATVTVQLRGVCVRVWGGCCRPPSGAYPTHEPGASWVGLLPPMAS